MTMISIQDGAARRHLSRVSKALRDRLAEAARRQRIRKEMKDLPKLPRHLLRDMGLEHYAATDVPTISNHRF